MEALRDPFSRVHPMFWPVLWLSLRAFVRWTRRMIEAGHGYGGLEIEITWYGWIHVRSVDLSEAGKDFRRHMMGEAREDEWDVLAAAAARVDELLSPHITHHPRACGDLWVAETTGCTGRGKGPWVPAFAGMSAEIWAVSQPGTGPPLGRASLKPVSPVSGRSHPLPHAGRGAAPPSQAPPIPAPGGRWCWRELAPGRFSLPRRAGGDRGRNSPWRCRGPHR